MYAIAIYCEKTRKLVGILGTCPGTPPWRRKAEDWIRRLDGDYRRAGMLLRLVWLRSDNS